MSQLTAEEVREIVRKEMWWVDIGQGINQLTLELMMRSDLVSYITDGRVYVGYRGEAPTDCDCVVGIENVQPDGETFRMAARMASQMPKRLDHG